MPISESSRIGKRGTFVIPAKLRRRFGLSEGTTVIAEETEEGILPRPAVTVPIESYSSIRCIAYSWTPTSTSPPPTADAGVAVLWATENVTLFTSPYAIEEAKRNLAERKQKKRLERLVQPLHVVQAATAPKAIRRDVDLPEKDWPILGGAIAAQATHLITGDLKQFGRYFGKQIHGILVLPPADYIRTINRTC